MSLIMRRNLMAAKSGPTEKDYVQDGLIAMWDSIDLTGSTFDGNALAVWNDLIGGIECTCNGSVEITDAGIHFANTSFGSLSQPIENYGTIELLFSKGEIGYNKAVCCSILELGSSSYRGWGICCPQHTLTDTNDKASCDYIYIEANEVLVASFVKNTNGTTSALYKNAVLTSDGIKAAGSRYSQGSKCINGDGGTRSSTLTIKNLRVYSKQLSPTEIDKNYAIDKARFGLT